MPRSQNGWYASRDLDIRPLVVAEESFSPGVLDDDDVYEVLRYVAEQLHARVEPIVQDGWHQADDWGFYFRDNKNDPDSLSNHSSGTAFDYNATRHPNGVPTRNTWGTVQIAEIHKILAEVDHFVRWGGDYTKTPDSMHFEINADRAAVAKVAARLRRTREREAARRARIRGRIDRRRARIVRLQRAIATSKPSPLRKLRRARMRRLRQLNVAAERKLQR